MKLLLPNDCSCSEPKVIPKNWKSPGASTKKNWVIHYRFYDPEFPTPKQVKIKGMNEFADLKHRQDFTRQLLAQELEYLKQRGYNPITERTSRAQNDIADYIIHPQTPFIKALEEGIKNMTAEPQTITDAKNKLVHIATAARQLRFDKKPIAEVKRRHIIAIFNQCGKNKGKKWTANNFNTYRANLRMIYKVLVQLETVESNPIKDIEKKKVVVKIRETLTKAQREPIIAYLKENNYRFWVYTNIFFHSASRTRELLRLKGKNVELHNQRFKVTVKKGRNSTEEWRPVKDIATPFWEIALSNCKPDDFVFSRGLKPGAVKILPEQITKRWHKIKVKFKITADFYAFKHSNLDEIAKVLSIKQAQRAAGHKSERTTRIYATGEAGREEDDLKSVYNPL